MPKRAAGSPIRLTILLTHPVQYYSPWFRHIARECSDIRLTVLYASNPDPSQQATGYGTAFEWDIPVLGGYDSVFARDHEPGAAYGTDAFRGIDVRDIGRHLDATKPDVVLVPGWHSITYLRALWWCRRHRVPTIWRGDTHGMGRRSPVWYLRTRTLLHLFDLHLSVGADANAYLRRFGIDGTRIFASPHHVDNTHFAMTDAERADARESTRARLGITSTSFVVTVVGKIAPHKRPIDVIDAVSRLGVEARVLLVGDGVERQQCEAHAKSVGVPIVTTGFVNQGDLPAMYAAADVIVLAGSESWGLVLNEALAVGIPAISNDHAGATRDLVVPGVTGERYHRADVADLTTALRSVHDGLRAGRYRAADCQRHVARYSIAAATTGLVAACDAAVRIGVARILAVCGGLFAPTGMERMTFEILRMTRRVHARVHCSVNNWAPALWPGSPHLIVTYAQETGASWSESRYRTRLNRSLNPLRQIAVLWDVLVTSSSLLRDARRIRATTVFIPEFTTALRTLPALAWLRVTGRRIILKLPTPVPEGRFYGRIFRRLLDPVVSAYVSQSAFTEQTLLSQGIRKEKSVRISNVVPTRAGLRPPRRPVLDGSQPIRIVFMGQVIAAKGVSVLLEAVALCKSRGLDVSLEIAGDMDGWALPEVLEYRKQLRARAARDDLRNNVVFLGFRDDIYDILDGAALLCVPSMPEQREAFGLVVIEAKNASVPCVVFPTGALPEHIVHGVDGWICSDVSVEALAAGIAGVIALQQAGADMGAAARASLAQYDYKTMEPRWQQLLTAS